MPLIYFYTPPKTLENLWFYGVFRGDRKRPVAWNGLAQLILHPFFQNKVLHALTYDTVKRLYQDQNVDEFFLQSSDQYLMTFQQFAVNCDKNKVRKRFHVKKLLVASKNIQSPVKHLR